MKALARWAARLSLRLKLTVGYALIFSLTALIFAAGVYVTARNDLRATLDADLRATAGLAQADLRSGGTHFTAALKSSHETAIELLSPQGAVLDQVGRTLGKAPLPFRPAPGFSDASEQRVLTLAVPQGVLRVSRPSDTLAELLETLGRVMLLGAAFLVLIACLAGYWLADRALRPVDQVALIAGRIARDGSYRERVPPAAGGDEMARLTQTVNRMLDQLEQTIEREKRFARTAAHELRTPLTALKARLELTLERVRDEAAYQKSLSSALLRVDDLIRLSEGLLALSSTEAPATLEQVELASVALEAVELIGGDRRVQLDVEESWVNAEAAGVRQLVVNLLDNALKYGSQSVTLTVRRGELLVQDGGPGPTPSEWARLIRPFERGARTQHLPGSGLGLALVCGLAGRWSASVTPEWQPEGFTVRVSWP